MYFDRIATYGFDTDATPVISKNSIDAMNYSTRRSARTRNDGEFDYEPRAGYTIPKTRVGITNEKANS